MLFKNTLFQKDKKTGVNPESVNSVDENKLVYEITKNQDKAETVRGTNATNNNGSKKSGVELQWEDEYKMFVGDHWDVSFVNRSKESKKCRPNSVDNFVFSAITNMHAVITSNTPEVAVERIFESEEQDELTDKIGFMLKFNDQRNKFKSIWKKLVLDFISYGPVIGAVLFDPEWIGGSGPNRWVGDVRILRIDRRNIFFDPSIIDLEDRLQECSFIHRKFRKKIDYIQDRWKDKGQYVAEDSNDNELQDEGQEHGQVWLIESWQKGLPKMPIPAKYKKKFTEKAAELEAEGDYYKAQEYRDMASGKLKGVHCAYIANQVFLEYIPYVYEDGLYPFVYKNLYYDENNQAGFGEIRNIMIPQIMHNKADEIEIEASSREGLGGMYYGKGAVNPRQKETILKNSGKGGSWLEVDNINGLKEREGARVPSALVNYKEHKQRMCESISSNTPIQQGMAPKGNIPFAAIQELGARTDTKIKGKIEILEDFLIEMNQLRINRFAQFYTEDRYYRVKGEDGKINQGTLNSKEMFLEWVRDEIKDEMGNVIEVKKEKFVPEFDVTVKILDEKPTDRNYYTNTAVSLYGQQAMTVEDLWYTLEEGKFPLKEQVLEHLQAQNMAMQIQQTMESIPPEMRDIFMQQQQQLLQQLMQSQQQQLPQQGQQQQMSADEFMQSLPDDIQSMIINNPDGAMALQQMMELPPEELQLQIQQLQSNNIE